MYHFVAGLVTDGEFNSLRSRGQCRPVNILQIRANVRTKMSKIGIEKLRNMLTPRSKSCKSHSLQGYFTVCCAAGADCEQAVVSNPAVPPEMLSFIRRQLDCGILWIAVVRALRVSVIPAGYAKHTWSGGTVVR